MDDEKKDIMPSDHSDYKPVNRFDASAVHHLSGMYQNWFLDYASYVILERAVPHIEDGFEACATTHTPLDEAHGRRPFQQGG